MLEFESKRKLKKRLYSKFTLIVLFIIFVLVAHGAWGIYQKKRMVSNDLVKSEQKLNDYDNRKIKLESEIERLDSDVGREELLREKYSLAKEGEKAVFVLDDKNSVEEIPEEKGFFGKVGGFFGRLFN